MGGRRRRTTVYVQTSTTLRVIGVDTRQRARRPPWRRPGPVNLRGTPASHPWASARRPALPLSEVRDPSVVRGGWIEVALDRSSRRKIDRSRSRPGEVRLRPLRRAEVPYCEIGVGVEEPLCDDGSHPPGGQPAEPLLVLAHGRPANRSDTRLRTVSGIAPAFPPRGVVVRVAGVVAPLTCCASASSGSRTGAFTAGTRMFQLTGGRRWVVAAATCVRRKAILVMWISSPSRDHECRCRPRSRKLTVEGIGPSSSSSPSAPWCMEAARSPRWPSA
ncbi:MAG: hypothetical protein JWR58_2172 [Pseudonocardia sp.]|nr:hypothetical protein [Pseudonocardia sp.]